MYSNKRGETVIVGLSTASLAHVVDHSFTEVNNQGVRYFGVVLTQTFGTFSRPLNITWISLTCTEPEERALAMAMVIVGATIAELCGVQIFRSDDNPRYRRVFVIVTAVLAFGIVLAVVRKVGEVVNGRKGKQDNDASEEDLKGMGGSVHPSDLQPQPTMIGSNLMPVVSLTTRRGGRCLALHTRPEGAVPSVHRLSSNLRCLSGH